ncbi:isopenicillin N synthase family oxygenase [Aquabacterium soli]|uniref:2-oxoglutarate-dependent ethylene/succinate-forming enzyme n=1 Tax=Aquabacterium soli TaxID=2493092 RepID=A0A3R8YMX5_9BURK|nr:2-oxoglutarate and iron-dependent oxygenase domain-containing protein [Aquabacterium soli]RRS04102.1 isopenicillin N synthase family oxygenase [Aquabacterium soli]
MHSLPIIDLSQTEGLAERIDQACRDRGFFYLVGHGVDPALRAAVFDAAQRFFALSEAEKARWHIERSGIHRGFDPIGWQALEPGQPGDLKESFYLGVDRGADDPLVKAGTPNQGPNQWPDEALVPGFRQAVQAYEQALNGLSHRLLSLMAAGLRLAPDHFEAYLHDPMPVLRLLHYPEQPPSEALLPGQLGCGAHTDWGSVTLLAQDDAGGLQVQAADGSWFDAPPVEGSFVVNLGDMMARWTNDRYRSTPHRVFNPQGRERYSIAYFFDIDYHAEVSALPGCFDDADPPRYPPTTAGQHIIEMYERTRASH